MEKLIQARIPADVHKQMKVYCAKHDKNLKDFVSELIIKEIKKDKN